MGRPRKKLPETPPPFSPLEYRQSPDPASTYLARLPSPTSRRTQESACRFLALVLTGQEDTARVPWDQLSNDGVMALRAWMSRTFEVNTSNRYLAAIRGILAVCWRSNQISRDELERIREVQNLKLGNRKRVGRALTADELLRLFRACADGTPKGSRDAGLIALLFGAALRISEACGVHLVDLGPDWVRVRSGKGNLPRLVFLPPGTILTLAAWIETRGSHPGPLFGGRDQNQCLNKVAAWAAISLRGKRGGVHHFTPHDLRRTAITAMLDAGIDLATVAKIAGHASTSTTTLYDRRDDAMLRSAAQTLTVPYFPRLTDEIRASLPNL